MLAQPRMGATLVRAAGVRASGAQRLVPGGVLELAAAAVDGQVVPAAVLRHLSTATLPQQ